MPRLTSLFKTLLSNGKDQRIFCRNDGFKMRLPAKTIAPDFKGKRSKASFDEN
jgi:hypothetical protein